MPLCQFLRPQSFCEEDKKRSYSDADWNLDIPRSDVCPADVLDTQSGCSWIWFWRLGCGESPGGRWD